MDAAAAPAVVRRYLRRALGSAARPALVRLSQRGELRTAPESSRWLPFSAVHEARADRPEFEWNARVRLAPGVRLAIRDSLRDGQGAGEVRLFGIRLARDRGTMPLHAGSLHRWLAEAVWYPWALVPSPLLSWEAIDDSRALAWATDGDVRVSLEFRFDAQGDVAAIYTPARWGRFAGAYREAPWEGRFGAWRERAGMRVPAAGEVGWYVQGEWACVWRGRVTDA